MTDLGPAPGLWQPIRCLEARPQPIGATHDLPGWAPRRRDAIRRTRPIGQVALYHPPNGYDTFTWSGRISPSGRFLAALVGHNGDYRGRAIWLLDRKTGDSRAVSDPTTYVDYLAWAPNDDQVFANSWSYGQSLTVVWRYQVRDEEFAAVVMPFGGALSSVVVENSVADAYIGVNADSTKECPAPSIQPSGRASICTFRY